ncbi:unnamed protein product [Nippostrongylus brasiliensis]|uniref:Transcriptional regulator n=1 Tax=Nippostrongylus brasiliensis TaxID=27835 RepID=A0A0N4XJN1_NIPBR|nr:unnamed protein product [Nippostrongylus brasiliensis]
MGPQLVTELRLKVVNPECVAAAMQEVIHITLVAVLHGVVNITFINKASIYVDECIGHDRLPEVRDMVLDGA